MSECLNFIKYVKVSIRLMLKFSGVRSVLPVSNQPSYFFKNLILSTLS